MDGETMPIAVRSFVCKSDSDLSHKKSFSKKKVRMPSVWTLVFDTETITDETQKLRFGTFQVRKSGELLQSGIFYDPETLKKKEIKTLQEYCLKNNLVIMTVQEFIDDVFYRVGYQYRATIVGFNLPFDISRLAIDHSTARASRWNKIMQGGFSFKLSENEYLPRVQIKHVSSKNSFIQFAASKGQRTTKGDRKKGRFQPVRRGFFIDIKTLAAALTSKSHSLASLAQALGISAQKHDTDEHGNALTPEYVAYAVQDTQTTWECFCALKVMYETHGLKLTAAHNIHSEASLGKAYLKDMSVQPWRKTQSDFPSEIIGNIMSAYYGGRSEVHIRREISQILYCDFLSMYPTVCTLMGLWRFVTAQGMTWEDTTDATQAFLNEVTLDHLQQQETWLKLSTLVQVMPEKEIFPVRARYGEDSQYTIGSNYLTSATPLWFTLADCIAAKLLTGRTPRILQARTFASKDRQEGLKPVDIAGNENYRVDPNDGDFFKRVIDLRSAVKKEIKAASKEEKSTLESQQLALKILANATSYGIFVELNGEDENTLQDLLCYGAGDKPTPIKKKKFEKTGSFFHPLLSTLITGAARLMLAITERLATDAGIDWAFCDTDSMALAKPEGMKQDEFYARAQQVQEWFTPLNPYTEKTPLFKIEDYNYSLDNKGELEPLYCYAISSKRYALFNINVNGGVILRKVSAHGLGHLMPPYHRKDKSDLEGAQPWQQDLWLEIINSAREDMQPDYTKLENFHSPAASRYGATTPVLSTWFDEYNRGKPYKDTVRPFNFLLAMQAQPDLKALKPVSPYNRNPAKALEKGFDRATGDKVSKSQLKNYVDAVAQYHLHPETKFLNGDYLDQGKTQRRHIIAQSIQHIGKEANKWEEQFYLGLDPEAQIEYGVCQEQKDEIMGIVLQAIADYGARRIAEQAKLTERYVLDVRKGKSIPSSKALAKLHTAVKILKCKNLLEDDLQQEVKRLMVEKWVSVRKLAESLKVDYSNLAKILSGQRAHREIIAHAYDYLV